jgi:2-isopropylmalate synthase
VYGCIGNHDAFRATYIQTEAPFHLLKCHIDMEDDEQEAGRGDRACVRVSVRVRGKDIEFAERGNGPVDAFVKGLRRHAGVSFTLEQYAEHAVTGGSDSQAAAYIAVKDGEGREHCGAGINANISIASIKAVLSALNRSA